VATVVATLQARIFALEAELSASAAELVSERLRSAVHRADYERERDRADRIVTAQDKMVAELNSLRNLMESAPVSTASQQTVRSSPDSVRTVTSRPTPIAAVSSRSRGWRWPLAIAAFAAVVATIVIYLTPDFVISTAQDIVRQATSSLRLGGTGPR
jgi:hypothetical protein